MNLSQCTNQYCFKDDLIQKHLKVKVYFPFVNDNTTCQYVLDVTFTNVALTARVIWLLSSALTVKENARCTPG